MKFLYVTDLHGDIAKYEKILEVAKTNGLNCIINGGDMLPGEKDLIEGQGSFINYYLRDYFARLEKIGIAYLCMLGNDDLRIYDDLFLDVCKEFGSVFNIANRKLKIFGYEFIGMNNVLDYPHGLKDRVVIEDGFSFEEQLGTPFYTCDDGRIIPIFDWENYARKYLNIMKGILNDLPVPDNNRRTIYVMHMPPSDLGLGELIPENLFGKIVVEKPSVGSKEIYRFIETTRPLLTLHGHIHVSPDSKMKIWINKINDTDCIQPGQTEYSDSEMVYVLGDLASRNYERRKELVKSIRL